MQGACVWQTFFRIMSQALRPLPDHLIRGYALQRLEENVYCETSTRWASCRLYLMV